MVDISFWLNFGGFEDLIPIFMVLVFGGIAINKERSNLIATIGIIFILIILFGYILGILTILSWIL
ncbi:MAG: hypothetical protein ACTSWY_06420 [Promethearchaeota archaeon]